MSMSSKKFKSWAEVERFIKHNKHLMVLNAKEMDSGSIIVIYTNKKEQAIDLFARI